MKSKNISLNSLSKELRDRIKKELATQEDKSIFIIIERLDKEIETFTHHLHEQASLLNKLTQDRTLSEEEEEVLYKTQANLDKLAQTTKFYVTKIDRILFVN